MTLSHNRPQIVRLTQHHFGGHALHWKALSTQPETDVPNWLHTALDDAELPNGISPNSQLPEHMWLIFGPQHDLQIAQVVEVEQQQPRRLLAAYPVLHSPYTIEANIDLILCCEDRTQAVLQLSYSEKTTIYAFDALYSVNADHYCKDKNHTISLSGFAYQLEKVAPEEKMVVSDAAAIRHHRALNDILAQHNGIAPDNLQQLIAEWQPQTDEDQAPITLELAKMVAYLYGDEFGQQDEAWVQGKILGVSQQQFMTNNVYLYDVVIINEPNIKPVVVRIAYALAHEPFQVGDFIRGNIWLQARIESSS